MFCTLRTHVGFKVGDRKAQTVARAHVPWQGCNATALMLWTQPWKAGKRPCHVVANRLRYVYRGAFCAWWPGTAFIEHVKCKSALWTRMTSISTSLPAFSRARFLAALPPGWPGGDVINTFADKPATLSLGTGELSPAMEQRLLGLAEGTRTSFEAGSGRAFGEHNADMQQWVARSCSNELGDPDEKYNVGDVVQFPTP